MYKKNVFSPFCKAKEDTLQESYNKFFCPLLENYASLLMTGHVPSFHLRTVKSVDFILLPMLPGSSCVLRAVASLDLRFFGIIIFLLFSLKLMLPVSSFISFPKLFLKVSRYHKLSEK